MNVLGNTLTDIAYEKTGIFKKGVPGVSVQQVPEARDTIIKRGVELEAPVYWTRSWNDYAQASNMSHNSILALQGNYQHINASLAVALAKIWLDKKKRNFFKSRGYPRASHFSSFSLESGVFVWTFNHQVAWSCTNYEKCTRCQKFDDFLGWSTYRGIDCSGCKLVWREKNFRSLHSQHPLFQQQNWKTLLKPFVPNC